MSHRAHRLLAPVLLAATLAAGLPALAAQAPATGPEELHYRWNLGRLLGRVAGIFLPNQGDGVMTLKQADGDLVTELVITSEESRDGFWRYGSRIDGESGNAERAWSSYRWRGEEKSKQDDLSAQGVKDIVSGIYAIRQDPPASTRRMEIWSDGKIYPVVVVPRGEETRKIDGQRVATRHYTVRGSKTPDGRYWDGSLELWLAKDAANTPVEIHIARDLAALQLRLQSLP